MAGLYNVTISEEGRVRGTSEIGGLLEGQLGEALDGWALLLRPHAPVFLNLGDTYRDTFLAGIPARFVGTLPPSGLPQRGFFGF